MGRRECRDRWNGTNTRALARSGLSRANPEDHLSTQLCAETFRLVRRRLSESSLGVDAYAEGTLTASQMMRKNPTEAIVDKDNHLRDALKYILLSLPSPSEKPQSQERDEIIREAYATGNYGSLGVRMAQFDAQKMRKSESMSYLPDGRDNIPSQGFCALFILGMGEQVVPTNFNAECKCRWSRAASHQESVSLCSGNCRLRSQVIAPTNSASTHNIRVHAYTR